MVRVIFPLPFFRFLYFHQPRYIRTSCLCVCVLRAQTPVPVPSLFTLIVSDFYRLVRIIAALGQVPLGALPRLSFVHRRLMLRAKTLLRSSGRHRPLNRSPIILSCVLPLPPPLPLLFPCGPYNSMDHKPCSLSSVGNALVPPGGCFLQASPR